MSNVPITTSRTRVYGKLLVEVERKCVEKVIVVCTRPNITDDWCCDLGTHEVIVKTGVYTVFQDISC